MRVSVMWRLVTVCSNCHLSVQLFSNLQFPNAAAALLPELLTMPIVCCKLNHMETLVVFTCKQNRVHFL